jgi:hypothetical protein
LNKVERNVKQTVQIGDYTIYNVPTILLSKPTPTGEYSIREVVTDLNLARIYEHMKIQGIYEINYDKGDN